MAALSLLALSSAQDDFSNEGEATPSPEATPVPTPTPKPTVHPSILAPVAEYLHVQSKRHPYGHVFLRGVTTPIEFFRASFGGLIPCGSRDFVLAADHFGCNDLGDVRGRYVFAMRGNCSFMDKGLAAQRAGAAGVVVINHEPGMIRMPMGNNTAAFEVAIPMVMVLNSTRLLVERASSRGLLLYGALKPLRDECVDPAEEDEERRKLISDEAEIPVTAAPVSRRAPRLLQKRKQANAEPTPEASVEVDAGAEMRRQQCEADPSAPGCSFVLADTNANATAAQQSEVSEFDDRLPGNWVPAPLEAGLLELLLPSGLEAGADSATIARLAGRLPSVGVEFLPALFSGPVMADSGPVVFAQPFEACENITNAEAMRGAVVIVYRGTCAMIDKARNAEAAGAVAVVIVNTGAAPEAILEAQRTGLALAPPPPGIIQALADDDVKTRPVTIPAVMVSARSALGWWWLDPEDPQAVHSISGAIARLSPTSARAIAWEDLLKLQQEGKKAWPEDTYMRQKLMVKYLRENHPSSVYGNEERFEFLVALADAHGHFEELAHVASELVWEDGFDTGHVSETFGFDSSVQPMTLLTSPTLAFLLANMRAGPSLNIQQDGALRCRSEAGLTWQVHISEFDKSSTFSLTRRITMLLHQQACLEKHLLHNAAVLGSYLELLREESTASDWRQMTKAMMQNFGIPESDVTRATSSFIETAHTVGKMKRLSADATIKKVYADATLRVKPNSTSATGADDDAAKASLDKRK